MTDAVADTPRIRLASGRLDSATFSEFGAIYAAAKEHPSSVVPVDCSDLSFCGGNLAAALSVLHGRLTQEHGKGGFEFQGLKSRVSGVLRDTGLFGSAGRRPRPTIMPLQLFHGGESSRFDTFVERGFRGKGLPTMSPGVESYFFTGLHELFTNFEIHSQSGLGAWVCGQSYPNVGRVELTIVDHGVGIPSKVIAQGHAGTEASAIDWAMTGTNTTREGDVPGGLGLKVLREFIQLNEGELTIASYRGFWRETQSRVDKRQLTHPFPGTAVTVVINTKDTRRYRLSSEIKAGDIF